MILANVPVVPTREGHRLPAQVLPRESRGIAMRRLLYSIFTFGFFLGMMTGCQNFFCHTAGVCDCDFDDDPCTHRTPWVRHYAQPAPGYPATGNGVVGHPVSRSQSNER